MGGRALQARPEDTEMTHRREETGTDSPAVRLLDALRNGDDQGVLAVCGETTTVSAENMPWSCMGRDQITTMLMEARERFPGLTFESRTRHVGFGLVIDEARVRDVREDGHGDGASDGELADSASAADVDADADHPMYDEPAADRSRTMTLWRDQGGDGPPAPLNMPVRVTVRHDDLQVHDVTLSFPAALLRRALGMHVDPLEISLSEVQSAFISPVGEGFTTHTLGRPELDVVPPAPVVEPAPVEAQRPPRRRRRVLVSLVLVLVAALAAGGWWVVQGRQGTGAEASEAPAPAPQPSASTSVAPTPSASASPTSSPSASLAPTVTTGNASAAPTGKPNVTLKSDLAFGFNSATLSRSAQEAIDKVAGQVRGAGLSGKIYVEGYTDDLGSAAYGQVLSQRRADAVSTYLQSQLVGVPVSIVSVGHGESDPVADNSTAAGRRANRRVTITLPSN
jgi:outer membrane protein OmpA-like peptidoglycan-associated protein